MAASAYHVVQRKWKIVSLDTIAFLDAHECINNVCIYKVVDINSFVQILCIRYPDRLLDVSFLLLAVILLEFHENPRRKH